MKHIFNIAAAAVLSCTLFASCSDFLDEKTNGQVFDNVLESQSGLEAALTGAYLQWNGGWGYGFLHTWPYEITMGGEDLTTNASSTNTKELDTYTVTNTNSSIPCIYKSCYKAIINANNVIENADKCKGDAAVIKQILGEAYFVRAYSYFWLGRMHKSLPLMLSAVYKESDKNMEMTGTEGIFAQIESDLTNSIERLGDERRNGDPGRPNVGTARALLAEVYLFEAGWPLKKEGYYAKAAEQAKLVLDNRAKYGFDFEDSYDVLFTHSESAPNNGITKENVFTMCTKSGDNWMYGTASGPSMAGGWGYFFAEVGYYNEFPAGPRKDATFMEDYVCTDGVTRNWKDMTDKHPYYKKMSVDNTFTVGGATVPICFLRFSQTALTYAEAKARSGSPDALAYECLNKIRTRAGLSTYSGLSAEAFANACVEERKWEFAAEGVRWFDVVRLNLIDKAIASRSASELPISGTKGSDAYFFPVPNTDELLNPNINK